MLIKNPGIIRDFLVLIATFGEQGRADTNKNNGKGYCQRVPRLNFHTQVRQEDFAADEYQDDR